MDVATGSQVQFYFLRQARESRGPGREGTSLRMPVASLYSGTTSLLLATKDPTAVAEWDVGATPHLEHRSTRNVNS